MARSSLTRRRHTTKRQRERGETLVEFAFASLIFFTFIFGVLQFGIAIWNYNLISDLAQEGARYAAVHGKDSGSAVNTLAVQTYVRNLAYGLSTAVTATTPNGSPDTLIAGSTVSVRVAYTLSAGGGVLPTWSIPINSTAHMTVTR